jgi:hypothetical protein
MTAVPSSTTKGTTYRTYRVYQGRRLSALGFRLQEKNVETRLTSKSGQATVKPRAQSLEPKSPISGRPKRVRRPSVSA